MDELYDNLDNYNEENTITELQTENKELKSKLEEYASTLDKLQKDFDKLTSEYKRLELNYSSLLKTAKAEIERKTQIISNLNLEKDKLVLKSFHNKNLAFNRSSGYDKSVTTQNCKQDTTKHERGSKIKETGCNRDLSSKVAATERNYGVYNIKPMETTANAEDIKCRLLNLSNSDPKHFDPRIKNSDLKENIIQSKEESETFKSRALIRNRRKSMPAACLEEDKFDVNDKDLGSAGSSRAHSREKSDNYCEEKDFASTRTSREPSRENTDRPYADHYSNRRSSRFETSSLDDRNSRCQEPLPDAHKSRHSRYDSEKTDRYRSRDKSSHRHKNPSPDRHIRRLKGGHDKFYHRSEHDRHKLETKGHDSPPKTKNHWRPNREHNRNSYEKLHHHEYERVSHKNHHEKYPMKHKIQHGYDESDSKRMKIEPHNKQHEVEQRFQEEKEFLGKKFVVEPIDIEFSTCESPDFNHPDVSTHQIREIKLTAATKLDDPRLSNKKYVLKQTNGKVTLFTAESENVDILPISKIAWGITNIGMPEALVRRPSLEIEQSVKAIEMEIENPLINISMESGEICDSEGLGSEDVLKEIVNKSKLPETTTKTSLINLQNTKDIEHSSEKIISSYKIPKLKRVDDDQQNRTKYKESTILDNLVEENTPDHKRKTCQNTIIDNDVRKRPVEENSLPSENKQVNNFIHSGDELPNLGNDLYKEQRYLTAEEVVEGDLELSDDNCDNIEQPANVGNNSIPPTQLENKQKDKDHGSQIDTKKHSQDTLEKVTEPCKNKITGTGKKTKNKKKLKNKEPKDEFKNEDPPQLSEIDTRKKGKVLQTKTEQIKTKFSELFDDSSSLISPEDLGLTAVPASTTHMPGKCVQFFEDALDAADVKAITSKDLTPSEALHEDNRRDINNTNKTTTVTESTISQDFVAKIDEKPPEIAKDVIEDVYRNLEPGIAKTEETVQTVIISTGIQPQIVVENDNHGHVAKPEQQKRVVSREVALTALATSTPYKNGLSDVVNTNIGGIPESSCNSNDSRMPNIENNTPFNNSDSNTEPQTNGDVPDVRIFVRRKRKIIKK